MAKVALLIGVSEYEVGLNPLPAAVKDVVALERILKDSEMGEFDEVKILTNPDLQAMRDGIETLFLERCRNDLVLLFFSGHGIKDDANNLYFATRTTKKLLNGNLKKSSAVEAQFIHNQMNGCCAKRQAIILDCCFSGAFDPSLLSKDDGSIDLLGQLGAEGRVVLASSSSTQYSFEQKGSDLSLYTRYLIEGIETGAGDRDEDGKITVRELHEYATIKVKETTPTMTPKLITLKDLGFDLVLAKAKVTDPKLKYRKIASRYVDQGRIRPANRAFLDNSRQQIGLTVEEACQIEDTLFLPYQERLANLQKYREILIAETEDEYPFGEIARNGLDELQHMLGIRDEDVFPIHQELETQFMLYQQNLDKYRKELEDTLQKEYPLTQQTLQRLRKLQNSFGLKSKDIKSVEQSLIQKIETIKFTNTDISIDVNTQLLEDPSTKTIRFVNLPSRYTKLEDLLRSGHWKEANEETSQFMLSMCFKTKDQFLSSQDIEEFPCEALSIINNLWVLYSNGKFGFSTQLNIWNRCDRSYSAFCNQVGWYRTYTLLFGGWLDENKINYSIDAPFGHLPFLIIVNSCVSGSVGAVVGWEKVFYSRIEICKLEGVVDLKNKQT